MTITQVFVDLNVSKATLAVCHQVGAHVQHLEVANTPIGFRQLVHPTTSDLQLFVFIRPPHTSL